MRLGWCTGGQYSAAPTLPNWVADARRLGVSDVYVYQAVLGEDSAEAGANMVNSSSARVNVSALVPFETITLPGGLRCQGLKSHRCLHTGMHANASGLHGVVGRYVKGARCCSALGTWQLHQS